MIEPIQKATDDFQKATKDNYDAVLRSCGELSKVLVLYRSIAFSLQAVWSCLVLSENPDNANADAATAVTMWRLRLNTDYSPERT